VIGFSFILQAPGTKANSWKQTQGDVFFVTPLKEIEAGALSGRANSTIALWFYNSSNGRSHFAVHFFLLKDFNNLKVLQDKSFSSFKRSCVYKEMKLDSISYPPFNLEVVYNKYKILNKVSKSRALTNLFKKKSSFYPLLKHLRSRSIREVHSAF